MSQYYYIASPVELDCGSFGTQSIEIFDIKILSPTSILVNSNRELKFDIPIEKDQSIEELTQELLIFDNEEDAAGIYIDTLHEKNTDIKKHFSNEFVYKISPNFGNFTYDENLEKVYKGDYESIVDDYYRNMINEEFIDMCIKAYKSNEKCKKVLFHYIEERLTDNQFIEFFSSWVGEEGLERDMSRDIVVHLSDFNDSSKLKILDRQYIRFYL